MRQQAVFIVSTHESYVRVRDNNGGVFNVPIEWGVYDYPEQGEIWMIEEVAPRNWVLVSKHDPNRVVYPTKFSLLIDPLSCRDSVDAALQVAQASGFRSVILNVAHDGAVFWNSAKASTFSLGFLPIMDLFMEAAPEYGIEVHALFDYNLWNDTTRHASFVQKRYVSGSGSAIVTEAVPMYDPNAVTREALKQLVTEFCELHGRDIKSLIVRTRGYEDRHCGFSSRSIGEFLSSTGAYPLTAIDTTSSAWGAWQSAREAQWSTLLSDVVESAVVQPNDDEWDTVTVPVSMLADEGFWLYRGGRDGRKDSGLSEAVCDSGLLNLAGVQVTDYGALFGDDDKHKVGAFEFCLALSSRMGKSNRSAAISGLSLRSESLQDIVQPEVLYRLFGMASNYGIKQFVVDGFDTLMMTDSPYRNLLSDAMKKARLASNRSRTTCAFICSSQSRYHQTADGVHALSVEEQAARFASNTDFILSVLFDSDLDDYDQYGAARTVVSIDTSVMTSSARIVLRDWQSMEGHSLVAMGEMPSRSVIADAAGTQDFWSWLGAGWTGVTTDTTKTVTLSDLSPVMASTHFGSVFIDYLQTVPLGGNTNAMTDTTVPMLFSGRSVLVGCNIHTMNKVREYLPWRLVAHAMGR